MDGGTLEETGKGEVSALLLYNSELPDSDRRDVEFYLANHWNMSNDLDLISTEKLKLLQGSGAHYKSASKMIANAPYPISQDFHARAGTYQWELTNINEQAAFWLDKNQNGFFETDERIAYFQGENLNNNILDSMRELEGNQLFHLPFITPLPTGLHHLKHGFLAQVMPLVLHH